MKTHQVKKKTKGLTKKNTGGFNNKCHMQSEIQEIRATPTDYLEPGVETCFHHHALQRILLVPRPQKNNAEICYVMLCYCFSWLH